MYIKIKVSYLIISIVLLVGLFGSAVAWAGSPDSPDAPAATNSFTLRDLYLRLAKGDPGKQTPFTEPGTAPGTGTMYTLNEIMKVAPTRDDKYGATAGYVLAGRTFPTLRRRPSTGRGRHLSARGRPGA